MGGCSAYNCTNHSRKGYRMFRFPCNPERRRIWTINCRRSNWEPGLNAQICIVHFEESQFERVREGRKKLKQNAVPTLFDVPNLPPTFNKKQQLRKICPKPVSILAQREIPAVESIIVKQEIEIEDGANTSASEKMKEISAIKIVDSKQEAEHEKNEIITVARQIKESLLKDELQQTKLQLQQAYTKINTLVAEKNELIQAFDADMAARNALFTSISEIECEFSKVKKELQQAYSEINALRKEKEELAKKVPASDFSQSIFQSEKKLHFYTGLNSVKDFQAVLSILSPDQSSIKILPFDAQVLIVLIKIKWDFPYVDLAYRFNISRPSVQRICCTLIPILETKLELIVNGPINKALIRNIPQSYKNSVYENLYQRMQRFFKTKNKDDESNEPDLEQM